MKFTIRILSSLFFSYSSSKALSDFLFESGTTSFLISTIGLALVLVPSFYRALYRAFAQQILIVDSKVFAEKIEAELKKMREKK